MDIYFKSNIINKIFKPTKNLSLDTNPQKLRNTHTQSIIKSNSSTSEQNTDNDKTLSFNFDNIDFNNPFFVGLENSNENNFNEQALSNILNHKKINSSKKMTVKSIIKKQDTKNNKQEMKESNIENDDIINNEDQALKEYVERYEKTKIYDECKVELPFIEEIKIEEKKRI